MRISVPNYTHYYDWSVEEVNSSNNRCCFDPTDDFIINFSYRKFNGMDIEFDVRKSIQVPRIAQRYEAFMRDLLCENGVPDSAVKDMSQNFKFVLERLSRRRRGGVTVAVNVDAKLITPEITRRVGARRSDSILSRGASRTVDDTVVTIPAKKAVVEALERVLLKDGDERECSICLEGFVGGVQVINMPCFHVFHQNCIIRWLDKNHFCPFCRFELPS